MPKALSSCRNSCRRVSDGGGRMGRLIYLPVTLVSMFCQQLLESARKTTGTSSALLPLPPPHVAHRSADACRVRFAWWSHILGVCPECKGTTGWYLFCLIFLSPSEGRMVCSALHFPRRPHPCPCEDASCLCGQPWPAASGGTEGITQRQQKVALHGGSGFPAGLWHLKRWQEFCSKPDLRLGTRS